LYEYHAIQEMLYVTHPDMNTTMILNMTNESWIWKQLIFFCSHNI